MSYKKIRENRVFNVFILDFFYLSFWELILLLLKYGFPIFLPLASILAVLVRRNLFVVSDEDSVDVDQLNGMTIAYRKGRYTTEHLHQTLDLHLLSRTFFGEFSDMNL